MATLFSVRTCLESGIKKNCQNYKESFNRGGFKKEKKNATTTFTYPPQSQSNHWNNKNHHNTLKNDCSGIVWSISKQKYQVKNLETHQEKEIQF